MFSRIKIWGKKHFLFAEVQQKVTPVAFSLEACSGRAGTARSRACKTLPTVAQPHVTDGVAESLLAFAYCDCCATATATASISVSVAADIIDVPACTSPSTQKVHLEFGKSVDKKKKREPPVIREELELANVTSTVAKSRSVSVPRHGA